MSRLTRGRSDPSTVRREDRTVVDLRLPPNLASQCLNDRGNETLILDASAAEDRGFDSELTFRRPPIDLKPIRPRPFRASAWLRHGPWCVAVVVASLVVLLQQRTVVSLRNELEQQNHQVMAGQRVVPATITGGSSRLRTSLDPVPPAQRRRVRHRAIDALVRNDFAIALHGFERLASSFPDHRIYSDVVTALRWKLGCSGRTTEAACR